jgi:hypothetical protein
MTAEELEDARRRLQEAEEALATFEEGMARWAGVAGGLTEEKEQTIRDLRYQRQAEVEHWRDIVQHLEALQDDSSSDPP